MAVEHHDLYHRVQELVGITMSFEKITSAESRKFMTGFVVPEGEVFSYQTNNIMIFTKFNNAYTVEVNMGGKTTEMKYVAEFDVFVGYRQLPIESDKLINYQVVLKIILLGSRSLLELTYHNIDQPISSLVSHDGTIHPIP